MNQRFERHERHESDKLTVVVIPRHGGSMFQWRIAPWGIALLGILGLGVLFVVVAAGLVLARDAKQRQALARAEELKQENTRVAMDLAQGRDALMRVAKLETELRHMLKFKNEKALFQASAVGGPTEEDAAKLGQMLDEAPAMAEEQTQQSMVQLMNQAQEREKSVNEILQYVRHRSTLMATRPTIWPVHGWISSGFGDRTNPVTAKAGFHTGVDIANDTGTPIHCTADGTVRFAGWEGGYGKLVVVNHGNGYSTYYGHLSEIRAAVGAQVKRGDVVGLMGATGNTTGPHLHYEIRVYGAPVDPVKYMEE
jgi:murein DD-endopeptidase MepM/ murein hydrolase activator NlpD